MFQFTLPRGERHERRETQARRPQVSIHAPAWGATPKSSPQSPTAPRFQFTLPRGERRDGGGASEPLVVSIHAPAWGATTLKVIPNQAIRFQFTLPRGERRQLSSVNSLCRSFNSRSRVGSDLLTALPLSLTWSFNSRSRVGSDPRLSFCLAAIEVSIHAPAWGATGRQRDEVGGSHVSIHAPAWGATRGRLLRAGPLWFQFTLPRGERPPRRGQL